MRSWVRERIAVCADGYTPDGDGVVGAVPGMDGVVVAAGFSGHGFTMASSLGAAAVELALDGRTGTDVSSLDPARFGAVEARSSLALG
ncbi:FAD-dependent oxidoreductase [Agrococcus terreus]|uniref:FAD-dependent oxidoreductase n=1 Tax=Agrococcus terreus TaxID=574649 RepID=UPI00384B3D0A